MAKKIRTYEVARGSIQEGSEVFVKGEPYTPPTAALEEELLNAGVIKLPTVLADADAKAQADADAKAQSDADAKAKTDADADADADAQATVDSDAQVQTDLLGKGQ